MRLVILLTLFVFVFGCNGMLETYKYSVYITNEGKKEIYVEKFPLTDNKEDTVVAGLIQPDGNATSSPYYYPPKEEVTIYWYANDDDNSKQLKVKVKLPDEFTYSAGSAIKFHIIPETNEAYVTFEIHGAQDELIEIDSKGKIITSSE